MELTTENLDDILKKLLAAIPEVKATAIVSSEGIPITSVIPQGFDKERIAPMTAVLLSLAKSLVIELEKGKFDHLYVKGKQGLILILKADPNVTFTVSTTNNVRLGLLFLECKRICEKIRNKFDIESMYNLYNTSSIRCPTCSYNMVTPYRDLCPNCSTDLKNVIKQNEKIYEQKQKILREKHQKQRIIEENDYLMVFEDGDYYGFESPFPSIPPSSIKKFLASIPGGNGVLISSLDGLPIASALPQGVNEWIMAPITTALFTLAERTVIEMEKDEFEYICIKGSNGYLLIQKVDNDALLMISLTKDAMLGLLLFNLIRLRDKKDFLKRLSEYDEDGDLPFPYIFKPPSPPGDLGLAGQSQVKRPIKEEFPEDKPYCKHCGAELPKGQAICHVCGKKVI